MCQRLADLPIDDEDLDLIRNYPKECRLQLRYHNCPNHGPMHADVFVGESGEFEITDLYVSDWLLGDFEILKSDVAAKRLSLIHI